MLPQHDHTCVMRSSRLLCRPKQHSGSEWRNCGSVVWGKLILLFYFVSINKRKGRRGREKSGSCNSCKRTASKQWITDKHWHTVVVCSLPNFLSKKHCRWKGWGTMENSLFGISLITLITTKYCIKQMYCTCCICFSTNYVYRPYCPTAPANPRSTEIKMFLCGPLWK